MVKRKKSDVVDLRVEDVLSRILGGLCLPCHWLFGCFLGQAAPVEAYRYVAIFFFCLLIYYGEPD